MSIECKAGKTSVDTAVIFSRWLQFLIDSCYFQYIALILIDSSHIYYIAEVSVGIIAIFNRYVYFQ